MADSGIRQHVNILGILYVCFGALGVLFALGALVLFGGAAGIVSMAAGQDPDAAVAVPILGAVAAGLFVVVLILSLPGLIVGIGLIKLKSWARVGGLILSGLNLLNFPFGTALGVYGLWVLLNKESEAVFT